MNIFLTFLLITFVCLCLVYRWLLISLLLSRLLKLSSYDESFSYDLVSHLVNFWANWRVAPQLTCQPTVGKLLTDKPPAVMANRWPTFFFSFFSFLLVLFYMKSLLFSPELYWQWNVNSQNVYKSDWLKDWAPWIYYYYYDLLIYHFLKLHSVNPWLTG